MRKMSITTTELATYLKTNASAYQSDGAWNEPEAIASALNGASASISMARTDVTASEIRASIDAALFASLSAAYQTALQTIFASLSGTLDSGTLSQFAAILGSETDSYKAVAALASRKGSVAESRWGSGTAVSENDVYNALFTLKGSD
jgi:hypothetical protein